MTGTERRTKIVELIQNSEKPLSGTALAKQCDVSRQVIVQDIALIRASGYDIISTNRGYIIQEPLVRERVFKVNHTDEQLEEELYSIIDLGGTVVNVACGLDTRCYRMEGYGRWYNLDLPETIAVRQRLLPENGAISQIAMSAMDD